MSLLVDSVGSLLAQPTWWSALKTALPHGLIRAAVVQQSTIAIPMLIETFEHRDLKVRAAACQALGEIGAPAVPALIEVLEDEERVLCGRCTERACACRALGLTGVADAIPILLETLRDRHAEVRAAACTALGQIGDTQSLPALCRALEDAESQVRRSACEALGLIGDTNTVPALIRVLGDVNETVRAAACWALGRIGDANAAPALRIHADYLSEARIALYCLDALETPLEAAVEQVLAYPQWWSVIIRALPEERVQSALKLFAESALPLYTLATTDSDPEVRRIAAEALERIEALNTPTQESGSA
ncbi:MAG: HEAT repeat domain-containing protein [Candidatus Caldarchaeum sp.]